MEGIVMQFGFLQNSMLLISCNNNDLLSEIAKYYSDYIIESTKIVHTTDEVSFFISSEKCEVVASFYQVNPKQYTLEHPLKLCRNVIDDYIAIKAELVSIIPQIFLHGSCVVYKNVPVILIGKSESGKSTAILKLLHALPKAIFLSDDFLFFNVKDESVEVEPYRMPLHIRIGSLRFNKIYQTTFMGSDQVYVDMQQLGKKQETSFGVSCLFEIGYGEKDEIREVKGLEKIEILMRNFKYYHLQVVQQVVKLASKIRVYQLIYSSDTFMVNSLLMTLHLKEMSFPNNSLDVLIKNYLAKKDIFHVTVQGNSMYPTFVHNQKILVQKVGAEDIFIGDVIFFQRENHMTLHRVAQIMQDSMGKKFLTKGDNNKGTDPCYVLEKDIIGKVKMEDSV